jgi:hypothetical protein
MTTSGRVNKAQAEPPARSGAAPDGAPSKDDQALQQEIEQTREALGETVEQLVAKTDVKGRARARAARLTRQVKGKTAQVHAKAGAADVRSQIEGKTVMARQKAAAASGMAKTQLRERAAPVWQAAPEPARRAAVTAASMAKQRRVPLMAAAAALIAGYLALRWWRKR